MTMVKVFVIVGVGVTFLTFGIETMFSVVTLLTEQNTAFLNLVSCEFRLLVAAIQDKTYSLNLLDLHEPSLHPVSILQYPVQLSVMSPCGTWLAAEWLQENTRFLVLWDVKKAQLLHVLEVNPVDKPLADITFNYDGSRLATIRQYSNCVQIWDVTTGELQCVLSAPNYLTWVAFSPDSKTIAAGSVDRTVRIWSLSDCAEKTVLKTLTSTIRPSSFAPNGLLVAACSENYQVEILNIQTGEVIMTSAKHKDFISSVVFSPDNQLLLTSSLDGTIRIWNAGTGREELVINLKDIIQCEDTLYRCVALALAFLSGKSFVSAGTAWGWDEAGPKWFGMLHLWYLK